MIMRSKEKPVRIALRGSDGREYYFLVKKEMEKYGDVRKESRIVEAIDYINHIFWADPRTKKLGLRMRTYSIVSLTKSLNLVEWVDNTQTLKSVVDRYNRDSGLIFKTKQHPQIAKIDESFFYSIIEEVILGFAVVFIFAI